MHQEIVLGESGQVFEVETSGLPREPVSVVVTSHDGTVQAATTSCVLDRVATVLSEDAPRGARVLHVGSTKGITPNTRYDVGGQRIWVYRLDGAHRLLLRRPLLESVREDTALRGCRILAPIDDAWIGDVSKLTEHKELAAGYRLAWKHGDTEETTTADVVRTPPHGRVIPEDIDGRYPGWSASVNDPVLAIAEAAALVARDVAQRPAIRRARDAVALRELVILRARIVAVEEAVMFRREPLATLEAAEAPYVARLTELAGAEPPPKPVPTLPPVVRSEVRRPVRTPLLGRYQEILLGAPDQMFEVELVGLPREPVSVRVKRTSGEVERATLRCLIDPVATVLTEDAPRGTRVLYVASTAGIELDTRYDLAGMQRCVVRDVDGEHRLVLRRPLVETAYRGSAVRGCRILAPIDPGWVSDARNLSVHRGMVADFQLEWTHADGTEHTTADLVQVPTRQVRPEDVERLFPGWLAAVEHPELAIAEAVEIVRRDVLRQVHVDRARETQILRELVILRAHLVAIEEAVMFRGTPYAMLTAAEARYAGRLAVLATTSPPRRPAAPPPPPPPPPPVVKPVVVVEEPIGLDQQALLDAIAMFFGSHGKVFADALTGLEHNVLRHLRGKGARAEAVKLLAAQHHRKLSKQARKLRNRLIQQLREA